MSTNCFAFERGHAYSLSRAQDIVAPVFDTRRARGDELIVSIGRVVGVSWQMSRKYARF